MAKDESSMNRWMTAINAQINFVFIKAHGVPSDNYWDKG